MCNQEFFMQPLPASLSSTHLIECEAHRRQTKNSTKLSFCHVCRDKANIINYGALSCQSCKTFFRRNGFHPEVCPNVHSCIYNKSCEINRYTRRCCTACRLAKCFAMGMSSDFIRKEEKRQIKDLSSSLSPASAFKHAKRRMSTAQYWLSDRLDNDRCFLVSYEQKILSNVVHALEIFSAVPKARDIIEDAFATFFDLPFNVTNAIDSTNLIYTSMRSFINSTPDFQILTIGEQCSLFQRNLHGIVNLYSVVVFRDTDAINNIECIKSFASIYGLEMIIEIIRICKLLDLDLTVIKLILLILAFSSNCCTVDFQQETSRDSLVTGTHRLLGSQNMYVMILWKYMICQYGYYRAALRFSQIIKHSLDLTKYSASAYVNNPMYRDLVNNFNQKSKQLIIINQKEQVHLWGIA